MLKCSRILLWRVQIGYPRQLLHVRRLSTGPQKSSDSYYKDIIESVYFFRNTSPSSQKSISESPIQVLNKLIDKQQDSQALFPQNIAKLVDLCVENDKNRQLVVSKVKHSRELMSIYPNIYCSIMGGMINKEVYDKILQFHDTFFMPDKAFSKQIIIAVLKLGISKSTTSLATMKKLYKRVPQGALPGGIFDELIPWLMSSGVELSRICNFMFFLIEHGDFPNSSNAYNALVRLIDQPDHYNNHASMKTHIVSVNTAHFIRSISKSFEQGNIVPSGLLQVTVKLSSKMKDVSRIQKLIDSIIQSGHGHILDQAFWGTVIQYYSKTPIDSIRKYIASRGININQQELWQANLIRQRSYTRFCKLHHIAEAQGYTIDSKAMGHGLYLMALYDSKKAREEYHRMVEKSGFDKSALSFGYLKGLYYSRNYKAVLNFFESEERLFHFKVQPWNYYLSAATLSKRAPKAIWVVKQMLDNKILIKQSQISAFVTCLLEWGRLIRSPSASFISRPSQKISLKEGAAVAQYTPYKINEIKKIISKLGDNGYVFPPNHLGRLFDTLDQIHITEKELDDLMFCLADTWAGAASHVRDDTDNDRPVIFMNSFSPLKILLPEHIKRIVYWGFKKSPTQPWVSLDILDGLKRRGIEVSKDAIMSAFSEFLNKLYGPEILEGEMKRIREQLDPKLSMKDVITKINEKWNERNVH